MFVFYYAWQGIQIYVGMCDREADYRGRSMFFKLANAGVATTRERFLNNAADQFASTLLEMCN